MLNLPISSKTLKGLLLFFLLLLAGLTFYLKNQYRQRYPAAIFTKENISQILKSEFVIKDRDSKEIGVIAEDQHRRYLSYEEIPDFCIDALIASEDSSFFEHKGVSPTGILRALLTNIKSGRIRAGGSTISMQTIENLFGPNRTIKAKLLEMIAALEFEYLFTKEEILEFYLNQFYVSLNGRGLGIASRYFFNREVKELTPLQCAFIIGSVKGPANYNPFLFKSEPERFKKRRLKIHGRLYYVLKRLAIIKPEKYSSLFASYKSLEASSLDTFLKSKNSAFSRGKFRYEGASMMSAISDYLDAMLNQDPDLSLKLQASRSVLINSSISSKIQKTLDRASFETISKINKKLGKRDKTLGAAAMIIDEGEVLGLSSLPGQYGFNRALYANRQFGSVLKTFVYSYYFSLGYAPFSLVDNRSYKIPYSNISYKTKRAHKADERFISSLEALARSENSAAVNTLFRAVAFLPEKYRLHLWKKFAGGESIKRLRDKFGIIDTNKRLKRDLAFRAKIQNISNDFVNCSESKDEGLCMKFKELKDLKSYSPLRLIYNNTATYLLIERSLRFFLEQVSPGIDAADFGRVYPSWPLGANNLKFVTMTRAFESFLNGFSFKNQQQIYPFLIKSIIIDGKEAYRLKKNKTNNRFEQVFSDLFKSHLQASFVQGTGRYLAKSLSLSKDKLYWLGGKTGTTNQNKTAAFFGFINSDLIGHDPSGKDLVFSSYVGYDLPSPMVSKKASISGASGGGMIFKNFLSDLITEKTKEKQLKGIGKRGLKMFEIDTETGYISNGNSPLNYNVIIPESLDWKERFIEPGFTSRYWQSSLWGDPD